MAAPTFVAEYEVSTWLNATTPKTTSVTVANGDVIAVLGGTADSSTTLNTPTGGSLTYTLAQSITVAGDWCGAFGWTAPSASGQTYTLSIDTNGGGNFFGHTTLRFSGTNGVGASSKANTTGAPSLSITTTQANSAIVVIVLDWNAVDGASRTWRTVNSITPTSGNGLERVYVRDASQYTIYVAYYSDAGTAGAKTVGLSAPGGQQYSIIAIEILGATASDQTVIPTAIASVEAFGTAVISATNTISPGGIASTEAFGTAVISTNNTISPTGIASAEAFGTAVISATNEILPGGIASAEAFGTAAITTTNEILPGGIASAEAFGTAVISATNEILPGGIASAEAFGNAVVALQGTQIIAPSSIASAEAFGTAVVTPGEVVVSPGGIASAEAFGTAVISAEAAIGPAGIASAEAFGVATVTPGSVSILPLSIASAEAFGAALVTDSSAGQIVAPTGIPSGEEFGTPVVWIHIVRACDCSVLVDD